MKRLSTLIVIGLSLTLSNSQNFLGKSSYVVSANPGFILNPARFANNMPTDGLVAYYKFSNNLLDETANNNDGTQEGGVTYTTDRNGVSNAAVSLDGINDFIRIGSNSVLDMDNDFTISAWINTSSVSLLDANAIVTWGADSVAKRRGMFIWTGGSGTDKYTYFSGYGSSSNLSGSEVVDEDEWVHLAITLSTLDTAKIYYNGVLDESGKVVLNNYNFTETLIGSSLFTSGGDPNAEYFKGSLDDIRLYSRVLTATEIDVLSTE